MLVVSGRISAYGYAEYICILGYMYQLDPLFLYTHPREQKSDKNSGLKSYLVRASFIPSPLGNKGMYRLQQNTSKEPLEIPVVKHTPYMFGISDSDDFLEERV